MTILYRSADWDTPWWVRPNRGAGRYNRVGSAPTQYLSEHPLTMFAERLRDLGRAVIADVDTIRWRCWAMDVHTEDLTVIDFDSAPTFGVAPEDLVDDDWVPCQTLAERLRSTAFRGVIVPSAALPGTRNVILFGPHLASPYLAPPIDPAIESPTAHVAERSIPPREVVDLVRWRGETHAGLEEWRLGRRFAFLDPIPPSP